MDYCDVQRLFDTLMPAGDFRRYWKARYLAELPDDMIDLAMQNAIAAPSGNSLSSLWNSGGATARTDPKATAFGDHSMGWMYSLDGVWSDAADDDANMAWSRRGWQSSRPYGHHDRVYLNFPGHGEDGDAMTRAAFGGNYRRQVEVKTRYDPQNRFRFNQNIRPETSQAT